MGEEQVNHDIFKAGTIRPAMTELQIWLYGLLSRIARRKT
jgi:hypothetical protein